MTIRQLTPNDAEAAARVHRASFDERLPWLSGLHTPEEDRAFYTHVVFDQCEVWGSFEDDALIAVIALPGELDRTVLCPAATSGTRHRKCRARPGAGTFPKPPAVDVPEEHGCAAFLRRPGFRGRRRNRRLAQRKSGNPTSICLAAGIEGFRAFAQTRSGEAAAASMARPRPTEPKLIGLGVFAGVGQDVEVGDCRTSGTWSPPPVRDHGFSDGLRRRTPPHPEAPRRSPR